MAKAILWVLEGEPKNIVITDATGKRREPDLDKVRSHARLKGAYIAGRFGKGVGQMFYGGKLGSRKELRERGNEFTNNDEILTAIGYRKTEVELDDKS